MHILILDDHPLFGEALKQIVLRLGNNVIIHLADESNKAVAYIESVREYDLIMVDLNLPGLDGFGFMRLLNANFVLSPVVVISATENREDIKRVLEYGAMGFIPKASDSRTILGAIRTILQGDIYLPEGMGNIRNEGANTSVQEREALLAKLGISARQLTTLELIEKGLSNKEIARKLFISESTVKTHVSRLISAFAVSNRTACIMEAQRLGLL